MNGPDFLVRNFNKESDYCVQTFPEEWMGQAYAMAWFLFLAFVPVLLITTLYSRVIYTLWFKGEKTNDYNCRQQVRNKKYGKLNLSRPESYLLGMGGGRIQLSLHNVRRDNENYDNKNSRIDSTSKDVSFREVSNGR